jgi:hypothetical protein
LPSASCGVHALGDVGALDGEVVVDEDLVGVEDVVVVHVADAADGVADDLADVDDLVDGLGGAELLVLELRDGDFTTDDDDIALHEGLAGDAALRSILRQASRMASEMVSATLSGWPSPTDSDEKM